jgi:hypothetical protein
MATLAGQTIASSYEQLLSLPDGGGNANTLVAVTDGDGGTTFGIKLATNKVEIIPGSNDTNAFEVSQADGTAVFTVNTSTVGATIAGDVTISSSTSEKPELTILNTNADASAPELVFKKDSSSPADNDEAGRIYMFADDDAGNATEAFLAIGKLTDVSNSSEDSNFDMYTLDGGSQKLTLSLSSGRVTIPQGTLEVGEDGVAGGQLVSDGDLTYNSAFNDGSGNAGDHIFKVHSGGSELVRFQYDGTIRIKGDGSDQTTKWHTGSAYVNAKLDVRQLAIAFSGSDKVTSNTSGDFTFANNLTIGSIADEGNALITNGADGGRYDVLTVQEAGATRWEVSFEGNGSTNSLTFGSNVSEQNIANGGVLTLLPDGNVGVGCSPDSKLKVQENTNGENVAFALRAFNDSGAGRTATFTVDPDAQTLTLGTSNIINDISNERIGIGGTPSDALDIHNGNARIRVGGLGLIQLKNDGSNHGLIIANNNGGSETVRFHTNGDSFLNGGNFSITKSFPSITLQAGTNESASLRLKNDAQDWDVNCQSTDHFAVYDQTGSTVAYQIAASTRKHVFESNAASDFCFQIRNNGNNDNRLGIKVIAGADNAANAGSTTYFEARTGNDNSTGNLVTSSGTFQLVDVSDKRVKTNIVDTEIKGLESVNNMKIRDFNWLDDNDEVGAKVIGGFIAQELKEVFEPAVTGDENSTDENGKMKPMGVSRDRLVPVLVKAIQELSAKVEELEKKLGE